MSLLLRRASPLLFLIADLALAKGYLLDHDGFGSGDFPLFAILSVFHAVFTALWGWSLGRCLPRPFAFRKGTFVLQGVFAGIWMAWTLMFLFGPWAGAISIPYAPIWILVGGIGMLMCAPPPTQEARTAGKIGAWALFAIIPILTSVAMETALMIVNVAYTQRNQGEAETILVPEGYVGPILIIPDSNGTPREYENGRRLLRIPASGVLLTRFPEQHSWVSPTLYYVVGADGRRTPLPVIDFDTDLSDTLAVWERGAGLYWALGDTTGKVDYAEKLIATRKLYDARRKSWDDGVDSCLLDLSKQRVIAAGGAGALD